MLPAALERLVFQRGRGRILLWYVPPLIGWLIAGCCLAACIVFLTRWQREDLSAFALATLMAVISVRSALAAQSWIPDTRTRLVIDGQGVHWRYRAEPEVRVAWPDITGIRSERPWVTTGKYFPATYRDTIYTVVTTRGEWSFTGTDIPSPGRAAKAIAARTGAPLQELPVPR